LEIPFLSKKKKAKTLFLKSAVSIFSKIFPASNATILIAIATIMGSVKMGSAFVTRVIMEFDVKFQAQLVKLAPPLLVKTVVPAQLDSIDANALEIGLETSVNILQMVFLAPILTAIAQTMVGATYSVENVFVKQDIMDPSVKFQLLMDSFALNFLARMEVLAHWLLRSAFVLTDGLEIIVKFHRMDFGARTTIAIAATTVFAILRLVNAYARVIMENSAKFQIVLDFHAALEFAKMEEFVPRLIRDACVPMDGPEISVNTRPMDITANPAILGAVTTAGATKPLELALVRLDIMD